MPEGTAKSTKRKSTARKAPARKVSVVERTRRFDSSSKATGRKRSSPRDQTRQYDDFVLSARRVNAKAIALRVISSPSGAMRTSLQVVFHDTEARSIRESFRINADTGSSGRAMITAAEATELGKRLSKVLLPPAVFRLLAASLAAALNQQHGGLRVRLVMDASLIDLPWEYLYRPDRQQAEGVSGFLLYDPAISLVRLAANKRLNLAPIAGAQRLNFIGAFWEGRRDGWSVWREFDQLRTALKPVSRYIAPEFAVASDLDVFDRGIEENTALFHYAGHCDFDRNGRAYCVRELPESGALERAQKTWIDDLAESLSLTATRVAVLSACNSGFWSVVEPLIKAGVPVVVGINGGVATDSTIEFCTRLYESLALGLTLDEAVGRARLAAIQFGEQHGLFDWGLYMVYMTSPDAVLFPRVESSEVVKQQAGMRRAHQVEAAQSVKRARELDGLNFGEIMSELTRRRVLILGRFSARRLKVLEAIKQQLANHKNRYIPELFTFKRPDSRDLVESILGFASLSRFVIADLSEPRSVQQELQAIVPNFQSVPIVPIINEGGREFATFSSLARRPNMVQPTLRYRDLADLVDKIDRAIVPAAEARRSEMQPVT